MRFSVSFATLGRPGFDFIEEGFRVLTAMQAQTGWKRGFLPGDARLLLGISSLQIIDDEVLSRQCQREASPLAH